MSKQTAQVECSRSSTTKGYGIDHASFIEIVMTRNQGDCVGLLTKLILVKAVLILTHATAAFASPASEYKILAAKGYGFQMQRELAKQAVEKLNKGISFESLVLEYGEEDHNRELKFKVPNKDEYYTLKRETFYAANDQYACKIIIYNIVYAYPSQRDFERSSTAYCLKKP